MIKFVLFSLLTALCITPVFGEYRVYQYYVRSKVQNINPPNAQLVTSTLNPTSYVAYNGGKSSIEVNLLRSWVCMGYTSNQPVCAMSDGKELQAVSQ